MRHSSRLCIATALQACFLIAPVFNQRNLEDESNPASVPARVQRAAIRLGMSAPEVRAILGTPQLYRVYKNRERQDIYSRVAGVIPPSPNSKDVYEVRTQMNTYELDVEYEADDPKSRRRPVLRVVAIGFDLDKRIDASEFRSVLDDLPEAAALCGIECTVAPGKEPITPREDLYLHPMNPTPEALADAERIGSTFRQDPGEQLGIRRRNPTLQITIAGREITMVAIRADDESRAGPVKTTWKPQRIAR